MKSKFSIRISTLLVGLALAGAGRAQTFPTAASTSFPYNATTKNAGDNLTIAGKTLKVDATGTLHWVNGATFTGDAAAFRSALGFGSSATLGDAAADGTTKGAATFTAADFNASSGLISLDYANAQKASGSQPGFLSSTDWSTFNNKEPAITTLPIAKGGTSGSDKATASAALGVPMSSYTAKSSSFTVTTSDRGKVFGITTGASDVTVTFPSPAATGEGFTFSIAKMDTASGAVIPDGTYFPDGSTGNSLVFQNETETFLSTGTAWIILGRQNVHWDPVNFLYRMGDSRALYSGIAVDGDGFVYIGANTSFWVISTADLVLLDAAGHHSIDWDTRILRDSANVLSLDWENYRINQSQNATSNGTSTVTMNTGVVKVTPGGNCTFNASDGVVGSRCSFIVTTSGTTSYTLTFGTNFKSTGTLATGTVSGKVFTVSFISDGTTWCETSRTTAM